jgi:2-oxoglutarate ferredoxin oxidoreductase subunit delta
MNVYGRKPVDLQRVSTPTGQVFVIPERCKGCRICIQFCPQQVLHESEKANSKGYHYPQVTQGKEASCVHCEFCTMVCPEFAIFTTEGGS